LPETSGCSFRMLTIFSRPAGPSLAARNSSPRPVWSIRSRSTSFPNFSFLAMAAVSSAAAVLPLTRRRRYGVAANLARGPESVNKALRILEMRTRGRRVPGVLLVALGALAGGPRASAQAPSACGTVDRGSAELLALHAYDQSAAPLAAAASGDADRDVDDVAV